MDTAVALKLHDDLLAAQPEGARHDSDICPLCVEKASQATASDPSRFGGPDVSKSSTQSTEGGDNPTMSDISQEAHNALLKQAVADAVAEATKTTESALATKTGEAADAAKRIEELETELASVKEDNERLNKDLDAAQVKLTSATDKVTELEAAAKDAAEKAALAEVASKRTEQVKNLKLFPDEYVSEKASKWASLTDEAWGEQIEEWKQLKPASTTGEVSDAASAMTGTSEGLTKETAQDTAAAGDGATTTPKRRAVLGLA